MISVIDKYGNQKGIGLKGDKGDTGVAGTSVTDLPLSVTFNGQVTFNIFTSPISGHVLLVNGVEYYNTVSYNIVTVGLNIQLVWLNEFSLSVADNLIFRKF